MFDGCWHTWRSSESWRISTHRLLASWIAMSIHVTDLLFFSSHFFLVCTLIWIMLAESTVKNLSFLDKFLSSLGRSELFSALQPKACAVDRHTEGPRLRLWEHIERPPVCYNYDNYISSVDFYSISCIALQENWIKWDKTRLSLWNAEHMQVKCDKDGWPALKMLHSPAIPGKLSCFRDLPPTLDSQKPW